ncbi:hypothetical protein GPL17_18815 [Bradyrhizobium yuanmingense]|uniref:hypothetical protein n=1 Tax=Bradyrhizobium yuanmingense TaxID=108015 RepID=UPI0012FA8585|nr:hypothetical protein [Bradyrhizobium yuanmingense]MVT52536.1 hypothetical protein [Bradyrhizobium yuanmingense]
MKIADKLWPLHSALAWVLTRDPAFTERAEPNDFSPHLSEKGFESSDEADVAWEALHRALREGAVSVFAADSATRPFKRIPASDIERCDWSRDGVNAILSNRHQRFKAVLDAGSLVSRFKTRDSPFALSSTQLGPPERPNGAGYMTLSKAVFWIATEGGERHFWVRDTVVWRDAIEKLTDQIAGEQVSTVGRQDESDLAQSLSPSIFAGLEIDAPYSSPSLSLLVGDSPYLEVTPQLSPSEWKNWNDRIHAKRRITVSHIQVSRADIARLWSFGKNLDVNSPSKRSEDEGETQTSGRGRLKTAILQAFKQAFPSGIPVGMSSQTRNDKILKELELMEVKPLPHIRTIERALNDVG